MQYQSYFKYKVKSNEPNSTTRTGPVQMPCVKVRNYENSFKEKFSMSQFNLISMMKQKLPSTDTFYRNNKRKSLGYISPKKKPPKQEPKASAPPVIKIDLDLYLQQQENMEKGKGVHIHEPKTKERPNNTQLQFPSFDSKKNEKYSQNMNATCRPLPAKNKYLRELEDQQYKDKDVHLGLQHHRPAGDRLKAIVSCKASEETIEPLPTTRCDDPVNLCQSQNSIFRQKGVLPPAQQHINRLDFSHQLLSDPSNTQKKFQSKQQLKYIQHKQKNMKTKMYLDKLSHKRSIQEISELDLMMKQQQDRQTQRKANMQQHMLMLMQSPQNTKEDIVAPIRQTRQTEWGRKEEQKEQKQSLLANTQFIEQDNSKPQLLVVQEKGVGESSMNMVHRKRVEKYQHNTISMPVLTRRKSHSKQDLHLDVDPWQQRKTYEEDESGDELCLG